MKSHAIIPIFIPHEGCPNSCVFCNQNRITANEKPTPPGEIAGIIDSYLITLRNRSLKTVEAAFYGGSFTGLPLERQSEYLEIAHYYRRRGDIGKIRLSTRPDYISGEILSNLERYGVDTIELGVQSFDDEVLLKSNRGHDSRVIYESSRMIQSYGFELGLQLMIGLPCDTAEKDIFSANELVKIKPSIARLYPTVVIDGTELHRMHLDGEYVPLTLGESIDITKKMYRIISDANIKIIRVGLKSKDLLDNPRSNFHPAFRQLVESAIARGDVERRIESMPFLPYNASIRLLSNRKSFSNLIGHCKSNKEYFGAKYPSVKFSYAVDDTLADGSYDVNLFRKK